MKRLLVILLCLSFAGCVTAPTARGSRILPWNWFSSDSTGALVKAQAKNEASKDDLRLLAQQFIEASRLALAAEEARQMKADGAISPEVGTASDMTKRAGESLNKSEGVLNPDKLRAAELLVAQLTSQVADERAAGRKTLSTLDAVTQSAAKHLDESAAKIESQQVQIGQEQQRALGAEEKLHKLYFWIGAVVIGYLLLQLLPLLSAVFPALAAPARIAGMIIAPAVQAGYNRMKGAVGAGIHAVQTVSAEAATALRAELDGPLTVADQKAVSAQYIVAAGNAAKP